MKPDTGSIAVVEDYIRDVMEAADVPMRTANKVNIAVDEIYSNIAFYSGAEWADVKCIVENNTVTVAMQDNGIPFDPLKAEDPDTTLSADARKIGGLGVFMTKKLMDEVSYRFEDGLNKTTMKIHY